MSRASPFAARLTRRPASVATLAIAAAGLTLIQPRVAFAYYYLPDDLVISVYGNGDGSGPYTDNQASPIVLQEVTKNGMTVGQIVLPQTASGSNNPISGEYGSSSEGTLQRSANGQYLTIAGYGVQASTFNANAQSYGGGQKTCITSGASSVNCYPLAQTASVAGTPGSSGSGVTTATVVPRVVALVGANGSVDTSTALNGVFNENNPRSVATVDGSVFYVSGQGKSSSDTATSGVFVANRGATTATAQIYGAVGSPATVGVDTRTVSIQNNQLYLSTDTTAGSGVTENISSIGTAGSLPTSATSPTILANIKSKYTVTNLNTLNYYDQTNLPTNSAFTTTSKTKGIVYLSPENYFFANASTLYVADSGNPKGDNNGAGSSAQGVSDGGLQKWSLVGGTWVLDYTLTAGLLNFVPDTTACTSNQVDCGTTGLIGLAGEVVGNTVELFATNSTLGDLDQTYLYSITDDLSFSTYNQASAETFTPLVTAASGTNIRGVALAPVPEPASLAILATGIAGMLVRRRRQLPRCICGQSNTQFRANRQPLIGLTGASIIRRRSGRTIL